LAERWYPIIDEEKCIGCNTCVDFCMKGVYENGNEIPIVKRPENCIEFCMGCAKICPEGAITFFGDVGN